MKSRISLLWPLPVLSGLVLLGLPSAPIAVGQEAATDQAEPQTENAEQEAAEVDPYEVPEGSVEELMTYMQTGPAKMRPRTLEDAQRMFRSLDTAANRVYEAEEATIEQRGMATQARVSFLGRLQMLGDQKAGAELTSFLDQVAKDPAPELQALAKKLLLDQQISSWQQLSPPAREAVLAQIRGGLTGDDVAAEDVVPLMKLADAVAETPGAQEVVELINESIPMLEDVEDPGVQARIPRLQGLVRRLELPGNKMEVEGTLLGGDPVDWESYRGKVVLVDYWATWCGPCIAELPNVLAAYDAYHDRGFDVLGISLDDDRQAVEEFMETRSIPWQTLYSDDDENNGWEHPMAAKYAINGIPRAILVDQEGKVVSMNLRGEELDKKLAELLGPAEGGTSATPEDDAPKTAQSQP